MNALVSAGMRQHFSLFLMRVFHDLHPGEPPLKLAWYVKAICHAAIEACNRPGARLVINVPPRHLKSIISSVALPAYLLGIDPTRRIMVATYSQDLARQHASQCRAIMQSDWYLALFPRTRIAEDGNRAFELVTTERGGRLAVSVGGTVTGRGADIIIVDDCLKADDARSEAKRLEAKEWFDGTLATRINTAGEGTIISISQRLHEDDLPAYLLTKGYDHLNLPAIAERDEVFRIGQGQIHHRRVNGLLDRVGLTREKLEAERRNLGPQVFSAQYQQNPIAPEGNLIRMEWFGSCDALPARDECYRVIQSWDTGMTDSPTSDYSVCTTWGYLEGRWYLLDVLRRQMAYPDLKTAVLRQHRMWKPDIVLIEDAGSGKSLWQEFSRGDQLRPVMWSVDADKETRLIGVTGQLAEGLCVLPTQAPWLDAFHHELRAFPYGRNDDQVDSMTQFLQYHIARGDSLLAQRDASGRLMYINRPSVRRRAA